MLKNIDFANMYIEHKKASTFKSKKPDDWDAKADDFNDRVHKSQYIDDFISKMNTKECLSLLDVGCGPGSLALPLSFKFVSVVGMDFSQKMLANMNKNALRMGIQNIMSLNMSWEDDWNDIPKFDVVIASRSLEVLDLEDAIKKMNSHAKKRVYLTYNVGGSYVDDRVLDFIGKKIVTKPDYFYVLAILYNMGIHASVDFIYTESSSIKHANRDEFVDSVEWSLNGLTEKERKRAYHYYDEFVASSHDFNPQGFKWAFISWEK